MWQYILNPFSKIPAKPMMMIGIIITVIGSFIAYFQKTIFDGIFDAHHNSLITYSQAITANIINIIVPCTLLFILARSINPKAKMIDLLNTSFYYRIPIYILVFISNVPSMMNLQLKINNSMDEFSTIVFSGTEIFLMATFATISLLLLVYAIILLFNGFKTASNANKWQHYLSFILVLIISEYLSKFLIHALY